MELWIVVAVIVVAAIFYFGRESQDDRRKREKEDARKRRANAIDRAREETEALVNRGAIFEITTTSGIRGYWTCHVFVPLPVLV
jgi:uncharacterized membrane protein